MSCEWGVGSEKKVKKVGVHSFSVSSLYFVLNRRYARVVVCHAKFCTFF